MVPPVRAAFDHIHYETEVTLVNVSGIALKYVFCDGANDAMPNGVVATKVEVNLPLSQVAFDLTPFKDYHVLDRDCEEEEH